MRPPHVLLVTLVLAALAMTIPARAAAEPLGERQQELFEQAMDAALQGKHAVAVRLFETALQLGERNIIHLNLGRSLQHLGRCAEAARAYSRVLDAPAVEDPPRQRVAQALATFERELREACGGELMITCASSEVRVQIDAREPLACGDEALTIPLEPGEHAVQAQLGEVAERHTVQIERGERVTLLIALRAPRRAARRAQRDGDEARRAQRDGDEARRAQRDGDEVRRAPRDGDEARRAPRDGDSGAELARGMTRGLGEEDAVASVTDRATSGWLDAPAERWGVGVAAAGASVMLVAGALDATVLRGQIDDYEAAARGGDEAAYGSLRADITRTQAGVTGLYISGGLLVAGGAGMWLGAQLDDALDATLSVAPWLAPGGGGAVAQVRW